jgi:hypothetical protein
MKRDSSAVHTAAFRTVSETADYRTIEGLGIPYGGPFPGNSDDWATRATPKTNFAWDLFPDRSPTDPPSVPARYTRPVTYCHGKDGVLGSARVGGWSPIRVDKWGVWVQAQISRREAWSAAVCELLDHDALSFSSQALATAARISKQGDWLEWPVVELSLTPTASNPWAGVTARTSELEQLFRITDRGGKPSKGTPPDGRLTENKGKGKKPNPFAETPSAKCAACDVSMATEVQGMLAQLMGIEQGEADQVALLKTAFDAVGQFIAAEAEEVGADEGDEAEPVMAWASSHLAHRMGKRNNGDDQDSIDAIHDLTVKLGASAHAGDVPPNDETHQEPDPDASAGQPPDDRSAKSSRPQTAAQPERIRISGLPG